MTRYPSRLGDTFRIYYADPVRWRSQPLRWSSNLGMDTSWVAPTIEAGGQVASSIITTVGESERQKAEAAKKKKAAAKKKKKKLPDVTKVKKSGTNTAVEAIRKKKRQDDDDDGDEGKPTIPWTPIVIGGAVLLVGIGALVLQAKKKGSKP